MPRVVFWILVAGMAAQFHVVSAQDRGFVRVEKFGERWSFVDAAGRPFFSAGANHFQVFLYLKPYNKKHMVERYGPELLNDKGWFDFESKAFARFLDAQIGHLKNWGFNTFGYHTQKQVFDRLPDDVFYIATVPTIDAVLTYHSGKKPWPDPFDPAFATNMEPGIRKEIEPHRERRNLIGYAWTDGFGMNLFWSWANELRNRGTDTAAKRVWIEMLKKNYPDASAASKAYGIDSADWEALANHVQWKYPKPPKPEETAFKNAIIAKYYEVASGLCRKYDPNHLVLGDKARNMNPDEIAAIAPYVDVYFFESYLFGREGADLCAKLAGQAGKPVLYGDGGFGFRRPERIATGKGAHPDGGKGRQFATQAEAGLFFAETMKALSESPYCVGWHYCGFIEEYDHPDVKPAPVDPNENGFMDPCENYNEEYLKHVRPANAAALQNWQ
jgi:hypothetical protein